MTVPKQTQDEVRAMARAMPDATLADCLRKQADDDRNFTAREVDELLREAARRLKCYGLGI